MNGKAAIEPISHVFMLMSPALRVLPLIVISSPSSAAFKGQGNTNSALGHGRLLEIALCKASCVCGKSKMRYYV